MVNPVEEIKFGSICSGIEAASVAWGPLGWHAAWFAEIEPGPAGILRHRFPATKNHGDMTKLSAMIHAESISAPPVLVGGTPCQAFSLGGLREGLSDARGGLTLSFVEIANAIDSVRRKHGKPECVICWENVPGVLTSTDNAFGCFLAALAGEDTELGPEPQPAAGQSSKYLRWNKDTSKHIPNWPDAGCVFGPQRAVAWRVLNAEHFGVPQRRNRIFVIASAREGFSPVRVIFEFEGSRRDTAPVRGKEYSQPEDPRSMDSCWWDGGQISQTLDAVLFKKQTLPEKNRFPAVIQDGRLRYITPREGERIQGFPDNWTMYQQPAASSQQPAIVPDTARYKAIGNSMAIPVMRWIGERLLIELEKESL